MLWPTPLFYDYLRRTIRYATIIVTLFHCRFLLILPPMIFSHYAAALIAAFLLL